MANKKTIKAKRSPDLAKRKAILAAATQLFLDNGYGNTSMDAVASRAGVTKQTVYSHFIDKNVLFTTMLTELCGNYIPIKHRSASNKKTFESMLYDIGLGYINLISGKQGLSATRLIMAEAPKHPKLAELFYESSTERMTLWLADFFEQHNARGITHIPNCRSAASYFFSLLKGRYHLRMSLCIKPPPKEEEKLSHLRENVKIFMHLFCSDKPMRTHSIL